MSHEHDKGARRRFMERANAAGPPPTSILAGHPRCASAAKLRNPSDAHDGKREDEERESARLKLEERGREGDPLVVNLIGVITLKQRAPSSAS